MINNALSRYEKHSQLLALDISSLRRPPLSSVSTGAMDGRCVTAQAVTNQPVLSCCANAASRKVLSGRGVDMPGVARRSDRKERAPRSRLSVPSLSRLIAEVIDSRPEKKALVRDIYRCLRQKDPGYFSNNGKGRWQGRVRRLLSRQKELFIRTSDKGPGGGKNRINKGNYWQLQSAQAPSLSVQPSPGAAPVATASPGQVLCSDNLLLNR